MSTLYQVLYCSRNCLDGTSTPVATDIETILAASRRNNSRDQVTGGLLFSDGCFAQVLEGPIDAVMAAFERIQCDDRHRDVIVLKSGPIAERSFSDWSMAFTGAAASHPSCNTALSAATADGDALFALLQSVVVRETEWLEPAIAGIPAG